MKSPFRYLPTALALATVSAAWAKPLPFAESLKMRGGASYQISLRQDHAANRSNRVAQNYGYWGSEGARESFCISSFAVRRRNALVPVAVKAFADLCNVGSVRLSERNGLFVVALRGGDAGDSYTADFMFRGVYLLERMVRHGEFPEAYERTFYRYNTGSD